MEHLSHKALSSTLLFGIGMLMLFFFCAPTHAGNTPVPTFRSTSPYNRIGSTIDIPATKIDPNSIGHQTYRSTIYTPFGNGTPSSNNPSGNSGSGGSGDSNDDDDIGIGGWVDTPSEPLPIGDTLPLFLFAAAMIAIIAIRQRKQKQLTTQTQSTNNNDTTQHMTTRKQTYQSLRQKLFLLLAFVCIAGQASAEKKTIYFRPSTVRIDGGKGANGTSANDVAWVRYSDASDRAYFVSIKDENNNITACSKTLGNEILPSNATTITEKAAKSRFLSASIGTSSSFAFYRANKDVDLTTSYKNEVYDCVPNSKWWSTNNGTETFISMTEMGDKNLVAIQEGYWASGKDDNYKGYYFGYYLEEDAHIYFENKNGWTAPTFLRGKDIYAYSHSMSKIANTNLYYCKLAKPTSNVESGIAYTDYAFISKATNKGYASGSEDTCLWKRYPKFDPKSDLSFANRNNNSFDILRKKTGYSYTAAVTDDKLSGKTKLFIPGAANDAAVSKQTLGSWQALNHAQSITTFGGGSVTIESYKLNSANSTTSTSSTVSSGTTSIQAAYTATVTLTATPNKHCAFLGWYDENWVKKSTATTYTYTASNSEKALYAVFGAKIRFRTQTFTDNKDDNKYDGDDWPDTNEGGTLTIEYTKTNSTTHTETIDKNGWSNYYTDIHPEKTLKVKANPKTEYVFVGFWNNLGYPVTTNPWEITNPENINDGSITARFAKTFPQTVNVYTYNTSTGTFDTQGTHGGSVTIEYPKVTNTNAGCEQATATTTTTWTDNVVAGTMTLTATAEEGYTFVGWYDGSTCVGTNASLKYAVESSRTINAYFAIGQTNRNFSVRTMIYNGSLIESLEGGTFTMTHSGGITYTHAKVGSQNILVSNAPVTFEATPNSDYEFIGWFNSSKGPFLDNPWIMLDPSDTDTYDSPVSAIFASNENYAKRQNINIEGQGTVKANYTYYKTSTREITIEQNSSFIAWADSEVTLTATARDGYTFGGWYNGLQLLSDQAEYIYTATEAKNITARFRTDDVKHIAYRVQTCESGAKFYNDNTHCDATGGTLRMTATDGQSLTISNENGNDEFYQHIYHQKDATVTCEAESKPNYVFIGWWNNKNGQFLSNPWISNVADMDQYVTARFAHVNNIKTQTIKIQGSGNVAIDYYLTDASQRSETFSTHTVVNAWKDSLVTLTANPLAGYEFDGWYEGETRISTNATYSYTADDAKTITAKFKNKVNKLAVSVLNYNPEYDKFEEYGYEYNKITLKQGSSVLKESYSSFEYEFNDATTVTLTATPEPEEETGYDFVGWYINNELLTKAGSNSLYTLTSDNSNVLTINLSGEVAVQAHFAPKKCWEVTIRNNVGGLYTVQYSRDANFTTYQTAESALDHYTYTYFAFGTTYVKVSPQPILGYKFVGFKVGGIYSEPEKNNIVTYSPAYKGESKQSQVMTNFVREDKQIVYLNLRGADGNIPDKWNSNDHDQFAYYAFVDNSFFPARTPQLEWIPMTHVQDECYTCTIPGNLYNRISFVQIGKNSDGQFVTYKDKVPVDIEFDTIQKLGLNYVRDTLRLENRRTDLTTIPATRYNCYRINGEYTSDTGNGQPGYIDGWTTPPTQDGDYQLVYIEQTVLNKNTIHEDYRFDKAEAIKKRASTGKDTVSLHIYNKVSDGINGVNNPEVILQRYDGTKWVDIERHMVFGPLRSNNTGVIKMPGRKNTTGEKISVDQGIGNIIAAANNDDQACGVWNFVIQQTIDNGNVTAKLLVNETHRYEGNYYIRTTNADGQYNKYTHPGNVMKLSEYAADNSDYSHYFIRYVDINEDGTPTAEAGKHPLVKFAIANDYAVYLNHELMINNDRFTSGICKDEYEDDPFVVNKGGAPNLPADATVRFGWDIKTNRLTRAYIASTFKKNNEYLVVEEGENIGAPQGDAQYFTDNSNWLYSIDLPEATAGATAKVKAKMNGQYQYFMGAQPGSQNEYETLISGNGASNYPIRLLYDFKDDRFTTIYRPDAALSGTVNLETPVMIEREHNNAPTQIKFNGGAKIQTSGTFDQPAYAVMTFLESVLADASKTHHEKMFYWISFPFDVRISDVFGLGDYGKYWIMEEYDGAQRAQSGLAKSNWKYITKKSAVLSKNVGYVLCLNYSQILQDQLFKSYGGSDETLNNGKLSLYFPSNGIVDPKSIVGGQNATIDLAEHYNANTAWNHHNWHIIGVPSFANPGTIDEQQDAPFVYEYWHPGDAYAAVSIKEVEFQSMHAYMVQYAGKITWTNKIVNTGGSVDPKFLAAKKDADADEKIMLRLELQQAGSTLDKTYVQLRNDKGTKGFDMSLDLTKIINAGANIYSIVDNHEMAGNAIPKDETVLPLGVVITAAGEYTFAMPNGTEGMIVELIDYEQGTSTNLLMSDYTITLDKGTFNQRFALRLVPDKVATSVDNITSDSNDDNVRKLLIDGVLYLVKDGAVYDAQGHCVTKFGI